jgi:uncharacterized protein (DUF302 family)
MNRCKLESRAFSIKTENNKKEVNSMKTSTFVVNHVLVESDKEFDEVTNSFEQQLGKFDPKVVESLSADSPNAEDAKSRIEQMAGKSGFMFFGTVNHGLLLSIYGKDRNAIQYVIGNPLIAIQITQYNIATGLYAPLRVLIYEDDQGKTCLEYDKPSSLFGQFGDDKIASVANMLDHKLEDLARVATECKED